MKSFLSYIFAAALLTGGYFVYQNEFAPKPPCTEPILYKIGTVDPGFGVSVSQFKDDIAQAGDIWSGAMGKTLFQYDPAGGLSVNLVYDSRQQTTQKEVQLKTAIGTSKQSASSVKAQYTALEATYNQDQAAYTANLERFNAEQSSYNSDVDYWNARGGAPADEYAKLQSQKSALQAQRDSLESERQHANQEAQDINALIAQYNSLVGNINSTVNTINTDGLTGTQFEQGVYISDSSGRRINIYQFDNKTSFIRVLAHELGHSIGLQHDAGTDSIMAPVDEGKDLSLTPQDLAAIRAECVIH